MKRIKMILLMTLLCMAAVAQNIDVLYEKGKALYEAKDYE